MLLINRPIITEWTASCLLTLDDENQACQAINIAKGLIMEQQNDSESIIHPPLPDHGIQNINTWIIRRTVLLLPFDIYRHSPRHPVRELHRIMRQDSRPYPFCLPDLHQL